MEPLLAPREDLFLGILAVLASRGLHHLRIPANQKLHQAFGAAIREIEASGSRLSPVAAGFHQDIVTGAYEALDDAMIRAEQFGLLRFPNPSYSHVEIAIAPAMAARLLLQWGDERDTLERAADTLLMSLGLVGRTSL